MAAKKGELATARERIALLEAENKRLDEELKKLRKALAAMRPLPAPAPAEPYPTTIPMPQPIIIVNPYGPTRPGEFWCGG